MKKFILAKNYVFVFIAVFFVAILALGRTFHFYYWWDDFSFLYNAKNSVCPFEWPFTSYCPVWSVLYSILGYADPSRWFGLAIVLKAIFGFLVYILSGRFFNRKIAFFLSLLSVSLGGEGSMTIIYTISESFGLIFLILIFLALDEVKRKGLKFLVFALVLFYLSLSIFPIYSTAHVFLVLIYIFLYLKDFLKKPVLIVACIILILIALDTYLGVPYRLAKNPLKSIQAVGVKRITTQFIEGKIKYYFSTTSSFLLTSYMEEKLPANFRQKYIAGIRVCLGVILNFAFFVFLYKNRRNLQILKLGIFSYAWLITQYLPRSLVTDYGLSSTDRHLYFPYIGFVMILGVLTFKKPRYLFPFMALLLIFNLFNTNYYFSKYVDVNKNKAVFYKEFRNHMGSEIPKGAVVYFDTRRGKAGYDLGIFIRAGMHTNEASIATELGVKIEDIKMYTTSTVLSQTIAQGEINPDKFFSFYWDGSHLRDTTAKAREMLKGNVSLKEQVNVFQKTTFIYDKKLEQWKGNSSEINFEIENFQPFIPSFFYLSLKADHLLISLPYTQDCFNCSFKKGQYKKTLDYLTYSKIIKSTALVDTSNKWEDSKAENLLDGNLDVYWMANRLDWFEDKKPIINLSFPRVTSLDGFILYSPSVKNAPTDVKVFADGKNIKNITLESSKGRIKVIAGIRDAKILSVEILKTFGDMPLIAEIDLIPAGYADIDLDFAEKINNYPAISINTLEEKQSLFNYLSSGVKACLKWEDAKYGKSQADFTLYADGKWHTYKVLFPIWGIDGPKFSIGCLNYPVSVSLSSVKVDYRH